MLKLSDKKKKHVRFSFDINVYILSDTILSTRIKGFIHLSKVRFKHISMVQKEIRAMHDVYTCIKSCIWIISRYIRARRHFLCAIGPLRSIDIIHTRHHRCCVCVCVAASFSLLLCCVSHKSATFPFFFLMVECASDESVIYRETLCCNVYNRLLLFRLYSSFIYMGL